LFVFQLISGPMLGRKRCILAEFHNPNLRTQNSNSSENTGVDARHLLLITLFFLLILLGMEHFKPILKIPSASAVTTPATAQTIIQTKNPQPEIHVQHSWISFIVDPLYRSLRSLHGKLGTNTNNWGWSIILFTVFINLCLLPFRLAMMRSSLKMRQVQPKVEKIKMRYTHLKINDPKKAEMQAEIMALYRTEGVSVFGGCLPQLIQMPLLYAMYRMLASADELRQAHWFWISDLAAPDPLHILPILIMISGFLAQLTMPQVGMDATQRRMMLFILPVVMGFMLWRFAAGLSLYWATGNLISLGVQIITNRYWVGKEMMKNA